MVCKASIAKLKRDGHISFLNAGHVPSHEIQCSNMLYHQDTVTVILIPSRLCILSKKDRAIPKSTTPQKTKNAVPITLAFNEKPCLSRMYEILVYYYFFPTMKYFFKVEVAVTDYECILCGYSTCKVRYMCR